MSDAVSPIVDAPEVQRALAVLVASGDVFEIRILEPRRRKYSPRVICGYFEDLVYVPQALADLQLIGAKGIYVTLNPVNPDLLARSPNKFTEAKSGADKDICCRLWPLEKGVQARPWENGPDQSHLRVQIVSTESNQGAVPMHTHSAAQRGAR